MLFIALITLTLFGVCPSLQANNTTENGKNFSIIEDHHKYYTSKIINHNNSLYNSYLAEFRRMEMFAKSEKFINETSSKILKHKLPFKFPFYGHLIKSIALTNQGYLYMHTWVHNYTKFAQYIAPFMANMTTQYSNSIESKFIYNESPSYFFAAWNDYNLKDVANSTNNSNESEISVQLLLEKSGRIIFYYKKIPFSLVNNSLIYKEQIKIGLADAFYTSNKTHTTMYRYHRTTIEVDYITQGTIIIFDALPTCLQAKSCQSCHTLNLTDFSCSWCHKINRCSSGIDRHTEAWYKAGCVIKNVTQPLEEFCKPPNAKVQDHILAIVVVLIIIAISIIIAGLVVIGRVCHHAYKNPQSRLGEFLIRYRPSAIREKITTHRIEEYPNYMQMED